MLTNHLIPNLLVHIPKVSPHDAFSSGIETEPPSDSLSKPRLPSKLGFVPSYVALLRGINVGSRNPIKMTDLRACMEADGFEEVLTYIQSGNVVFGAPRSNAARLTQRIERLLSKSFDYEASVVLRSKAQMSGIVRKAPKGFGVDPARFRSDVIFLKPPLTGPAAIKQVRTREGVDRAWAGSGVLYFERLTSRASQSQLSKIVASPIYGSITIRNWATTTKLLELMK